MRFFFGRGLQVAGDAEDDSTCMGGRFIRCWFALLLFYCSLDVVDKTKL